MVSSVPYVMIGATNAPFKTVQELLAYAKANPGTLNFGVPNGAPPHMLAEMFKMQTGADIQIVPYKGASTLITDMLAGRIHGGFETTSVMLAHLHEGNIRGLAVLRDSRIADLPDVPTMIESGVKGVEGSSWSGVLAPAGTPAAIVARLRADILAGLRSADFAAKLKRMAADVPKMSAEEFGDFIGSESTHRHDHEGGRAEGEMTSGPPPAAAALRAFCSARCPRRRKTRRPATRSRSTPVCMRPPPKATSRRSKS